MAKFIPFVVGLFLANTSLSQDWFLNDAVWNYYQITLGMGGGYKQFEVTGDTTIHGKDCKIISGLCYGGWVGDPGYLWQKGNKIFAYNLILDTFRILYDFNLVAGDTLIYEAGPYWQVDGMFLIDSVTTIQAGSLNLRVQHISNLSTRMLFGDKIIERIGSDQCLYPLLSTHYPFTGPLSCYADSATGLLQIHPEYECDFEVSNSSGTSADFPKILMYPNPTDGTIYIECDQDIEKIELFNHVSHWPIHNFTIFNTSAVFSIESLPPGIFYVRITTRNGIFLRLVALQK